MAGGSCAAATDEAGRRPNQYRNVECFHRRVSIACCFGQYSQFWYMICCVSRSISSLVPEVTLDFSCATPPTPPVRHAFNILSSVSFADEVRG